MLFYCCTVLCPFLPVLQIWVIGNSASVPVLTALEPVLSVVFSLFCFTKQNVSHLRYTGLLLCVCVCVCVHKKDHSQCLYLIETF